MKSVSLSLSPADLSMIHSALILAGLDVDHGGTRLSASSRVVMLELAESVSLVLRLTAQSNGAHLDA